MKGLFATITLVFLAVVGGLAWAHRAKPGTKPEPEIVPRAQLLEHVDKQLSAFDMEMRRDSSIAISGDLRPTWEVSGRLKNHTYYFVDDVWIEIHLRDKATGNELDSTVIKLDSLRLPQGDGVVAFARSVKLLTPDRPWNWDYEIIYARTEPAYEDILQDVVPDVQSSK